MITIPKKKLTSPRFLFPAFCSILLTAFFIFAFQRNSSFFNLISSAQSVIIITLFYLHNRHMRWQASASLQKQDFLEKINLLEAEIRKEQTAIKAFDKKIVNYSQLKGLTEKLSMCLSLSDTSETLDSEVDKLLGNEEITTILYLFHSKTGELGVSSSHKGQMQTNIKSKKGDLFDLWVTKAMQPLLVEDARNDFRFDLDKIIEEESRPVRSLISVPLVIGSKALGILRLDSPQENYFTSEDLRFLTTIGDLGAIAIENAQLHEKVEELAITDGLTGLYLRRYLLERMGEEISRELRSKKPLSFLMIDLDKFKEYNDKFGHMAGDILLKTIAMILLENFKEPGNLVCRYGGEEFAVLLPDCSKENAIKRAEEIRGKIKKQEIILRKQKTRITVSIGVATFPFDAQVKDELIRTADDAMYKAKREGRDRVCY